MKDPTQSYRFKTFAKGFIRLIGLILFITKYQILYRKIYQTEVLSLLKNLPDDLAGRRLRKRTKNYGITISGFFGPATLQMAGHHPTLADHKLLCLTGSAMPGFDACYDESIVDTRRIQSILLEGLQPNDSPYEQLAHILWIKLKELTPDTTRLNDLTQKIIEIQTRSLIQTTSTNRSVIETATREKGIAGALFFTLPISKENQDNLLPCIDKLGAWVQLSDDLHDLRSDLLEHNNTLISTASSLKDIEEMYNVWATEALKSLPSKTPQTVRSGFLLYHFQNIVFIKHLKDCLNGKPPQEAIDISRDEYYNYKSKLVSWGLFKALTLQP